MVTSPALKALRGLQKVVQKREEGTPAPPALVAVPGFQPVEEMTLEDFSHAGLVVRVRSRLLEEEVLFVSDNVKDLEAEDELVVYRAGELRRLVLLPVECLRTVHRVKKLFSGTVTKTKHEEVDE